MMVLSTTCNCNWALWTAFLQVVYTYLAGYWTMYVRSKNVDPQLLKKHFKEEHEKQGISPALWGYPDMGTGKYSQVLPYNNWFTWNCAMEAHKAAVETVAVGLLATLGAGYFCKTVGAVVGAAVLLTRVAHTVTYMLAPQRIELVGSVNALVIAAGLAFTFVKSF